MRIFLLSGEVELNLGPIRPKYCNLLYSNIRGLYGNLNELAVISTKFHIIFVQTLVSEMRHTSAMLLPNLINPCCHVGILCLESKVCVNCSTVGCNARPFTKYECGCYEYIVVRV